MAGRLRFRHLQLVAALQASGSLRAAADQLHQTQPALSKALKEIEDIFGFPLFERSARGVRATEQGRVVIRGAAPLLAELAHLQDEAIEARGAAALLRVGATPFVALSLLPQVFNRLLQRVPPVHPRLTEESAPRLHRALLAGELDALVSTYSSEPIELEGGARLRYEKLYDVDIAVIAPKRHPLAGVRRATWGQLAVERWILPPRSASLRRMIEERFLREGIAPPAPVLESTNPFANVKFVAAGLGLGAAPVPAALEALRSGVVKRVRVSPPIPPVPVALVARSEDNPRVQLLREALRGQVRPRP